MATASQKYHDGSSSNLPQLHRYITSHDAEGKAVFHTDLPEEITQLVAPGPVQAALHVHYHTTGFPVKFSGDDDVKTYAADPQNIPLVREGGSVCRIVDLGPGEKSPMHRTTSLDYGVVLSGEIDLILEDWDGPRRRMRIGDVSVQRGTMHAWENPSKDVWSRMLYVLLPSEPLKFGGSVLEDELEGIQLPGK